MPVKQFTEIACTGKSTGISYISHGRRRVSKHSTSLFKAIVVQVLHRRYRQISLEKGCAFCFATVSGAWDIFEQQLARIILLDESDHGGEWQEVIWIFYILILSIHSAGICCWQRHLPRSACHALSIYIICHLSIHHHNKLNIVMPVADTSVVGIEG